MEIKTSPHTSEVLSMLLFEAAQPCPAVMGVHKTSDGWLISECVDGKTLESLMTDGTIDPFKVKIGAHRDDTKWTKTRLAVQNAQVNASRKGRQLGHSSPREISILYDALRKKFSASKPAMFTTCSTPDGCSGPWYDFIAGLSADGKRRQEMMEKEYGCHYQPELTCLGCDHADDCMTSEFASRCPDFVETQGPTCKDCVQQDSGGFTRMGVNGHTHCSKKLTIKRLDSEACEYFSDVPADIASPFPSDKEVSKLIGKIFAGEDDNSDIEPNPTCEDCANQDESQAPTGTEGITFCRAQGVNVPLSAPACGILFRYHKSEVVTECENTTPQTIHEEAKTIAETVSDLYYKVASLGSQKAALVSANEELLELAKNCPECEEYCKIADAVEEENAVLRDHNNRLVKDLLAAKSWKVGMEARLAHRGDTIRNLQAHIQGEAKEIDILKSSLRTAEREVLDLDQSRQLRRAEEEYMSLASIQDLPVMAQMMVRDEYRDTIKGK